MKNVWAVVAGLFLVTVAGVAQEAADPFPPLDRKYFTATSPTPETVNAFMKAQWGFDPTRIWKVMAVQTTAAPGVSKVTLFFSDTSANAKVQSFSFFALPDGKHGIAGGNVIPFGARPFDETAKMMIDRATGATRGAKGNELLLVEFADMQCPHCKTAQATMKQVATDFPQARIVFENFPLSSIHPYAFQAAAYGVCVQKARNDAFFVYADDVFEHQEALNPDGAAGVLKNAVVKAGLDPAAIAACSVTDATKAIVDASTKLGEDAGVDQTPTLVINGRSVTITEVPYETLKQMITYSMAK